MQRRGYEERAAEMKKHRGYRLAGVAAEAGRNFFLRAAGSELNRFRAVGGGSRRCAVCLAFIQSFACPQVSSLSCGFFVETSLVKMNP